MTTLQLLLIAVTLGVIPAFKLVRALVQLLFELVASAAVIVFVLTVLVGILSHGKWI